MRSMARKSSTERHHHKHSKHKHKHHSGGHHHHHGKHKKKKKHKHHKRGSGEREKSGTPQMNVDERELQAALETLEDALIEVCLLSLKSDPI